MDQTRTYLNITTNESTKSYNVKSCLSHKFHIDYLHIIDSGFLCPHTHWTFFPVITGIIYFFILITCDQNISFYGSFPSSWFTPHARSLQIPSHDTSCTLISKSLLFVIIATLTRTGECWGIWLSIPYAIFHWTNLKRYSLKIFPPKVSHYFYTIIVSNCKLEIFPVLQIYSSITS